MKIVLKVLAVICGLGFIGQLVAGEFFAGGLILAVIFAYFGWKEPKEKSDSSSSSPDK